MRPPVVSLCRNQSRGYQELTLGERANLEDLGDGTAIELHLERTTHVVYFPRGEQSFTTIKKKFADDLAAAKKHSPHGFVFVTKTTQL